MSEPARLAGVYFNPGETFADIARRPQRWWIPLLLMVLMNSVYMYTYSTRVGWEKMMRQSMEGNSRLEQLSPEQREQAMERATKFAGVSAYVGAVVGVPVVALIIAGLLMFVMNMLGAMVSFKQSLAITSYTFMVGLLSGLLSIAVMFLKNPDDFDLRNPLAFNAGAFVSSTAPKWVTALAGSFDVFSFWTMALLATGFAAASHKMKWSKAFGGVAAMWLVWVVCKTGWAAAFG